MIDIPEGPGPIAHIERDRARTNAIAFVLHPYNPHLNAMLADRWGIKDDETPPTPEQMHKELTALAVWLGGMIDCMNDQMQTEEYVPSAYEAAFFRRLAEFRGVVKHRADLAREGVEYAEIFPIRMEFLLREGGHENTLPEDMIRELTVLQNTLEHWRRFPVETERSGPVADRLIRDFCHEMENCTRDIETYKRIEETAHHVLEGHLPKGASQDAAPVGSKSWLERLVRQAGSDIGPHKS